MIWSPEESAVAVVKASVTDLPLARGTRSASAIVSDTPVTRPPSDPDGAPALARSLLVLTMMPVSLPAVAGPNVTPLSVIVYKLEADNSIPRRKMRESRLKPCRTEKVGRVGVNGEKGPGCKIKLGG